MERIKRRKGEKNDPFQDQYDHRLRLLLALYYGTEQYRRIISRAFTRQYGGVTERFSSVSGRNCLVYLSNTAINGPVTDGVLVDLGSNRNDRKVMKWPRQNGRTGEVLISDIYCPDLAMDNHGYLYLCDGEKHEVRRWKIGHRNGQGNRLDQLNNPRNIYIDDDHSVYVWDKDNHRVMK